jgi:hypothetical protein
LIDAFLGKWLTEPERAAFQAHLVDCPQCQLRIHQNERLDRLLTQAMEQFAPLPLGLMPRLERQLNQVRRRRRIVWLAGGVAAALLIGCFSFWWLHQPKTPDGSPQAPVVAVPTPLPPEAPPPAPQVRVTFARSAKVIAVPRKTDNPAVTIIWVYPAVQTLPPELTRAASSQPHERRTP